MKNLRCYARISIENLLYNYDCIKACVGDGCGIIPIIKANAYSHGSVEIAQALQGCALAFAVAEINEALLLRESGIDTPLLILGYTDPSFAELLQENHIIQAVTDLEYARLLSEHLKRGELSVHIKLDTGMHRFGFDARKEETIEEIEAVNALPHIKIAGTFSHFAESDDLDSDFTATQLALFEEMLQKMRNRGIDTGVTHIANSAATLCHPEAHLSAVRPGIILYGAYPSEKIKESYLSSHPPLREVMTMCARVGQVHRVEAGDAIGYSRTYTFSSPATIATVTAGYADGIPRGLSNCGRVKINGEIFNIVGNVCMDLLMVDITGAKNPIKAGDEVVFWGEDGINIDEYARLSGDINYVIYTGISPRVTKIYE